MQTGPQRLRFRRFTLFWALCALGALVAVGCSELAATNPYDPTAPRTQQAPGAVTGRLVRPPGHDASRLTAAHVDLLGGGDGGAAEAVASTVVDAADGSFTVTDVTPGDYFVTFVVPGFRAPPFRLVVGIGETVALGDVALEVASRSSSITGVARRAGAPDDGHAGIAVEALGTPFNTATTSAGAFELPVTEGQYTLRFSLAGYASQTVPVGHTLVASETFALESEVVLEGTPGSVRGTLMVEPRFDGALFLPQAVVTLASRDGMAGPTTVPDTLGRFAFADVAAADYTLHAELPGFFPLDVPIDVHVGQVTEVGPLTLFAEGDDSSFIAGSARLQGSPDGAHGGTRVQAIGTPYVVETTDDGAFRLPVAGGRSYDVKVSHAGYTEHVAPAIEVAAGAVVELAEVTLQGQPGRVSGQVQLPDRFMDRLQTVDVCLLPADAPTSDCVAPAGEAPGGEVFQHEQPGADGRFLFDAVPAGTFALVAVLDGFEPWRDELEVFIGQDVRGGRIVLVPSNAQGSIFGFARRAGGGAGGHAGTNVSAVGTPYGTPTNDDGAFVLALPARSAGYTLRFSRPGYNEETRSVDTLPDGAAVELPEVVLTGQPGSIEGTVVLPAPDPVAVDSATAQRFLPFGEDAAPCGGDAECDGPARCVLNFCRTAIDTADVDASGHFVFAGVAEGAYTVGVRLDRFHPAAVDVRVEVGGAASVGSLSMVPLPAQAFILGTAQLAGGAVHDGIVVTLRGAAFDTTTTPEGRFLLAVPVSERGYTLDVSRPGYGTQSVVVGALGPGETFELVEPVVLTGQPGRLRLVVELPEEFVDPDLILQAAVEVSRFDAANELVLERISPVPQSGVVVVDLLAAGSYVLRITHPGFDTSFRSALLEVGGQADLGVVHLSLPGNAQRSLVRGTAQLRCNGPCSYGGIRVEGAGVPFVTFTNELGRFELAVTDGSYTLVARYPGYQQAGPPRLVVVSAGSNLVVDEAIELVAAPGNVTGRLLLPPGFDPQVVLPAALVSLAPGQAVTAPLANGLFFLPAVEPGRYDLQVDLGGFVPLVLPITVGPGQEVDLGVIALSALGGERLSGIARLADVDDPLGHRGIRVEVLNTPFETLTDDDGAFDVAAIPGDVTLRLTRAEYRPLLVAVEDLGSGEVRPLAGRSTLDIAPAGVSGRVLRLDADRVALPAGGATVSLLDAQGGVADTAPAGIDGSFRFTNRRAGEYTLSVSRPAHVSAFRKVTLRADEVAGLDDVVLDLERGAVAGVARRLAQPGQGGVTVVLRRAQPLEGVGVERVARSAAPGDRYELNGLPAGIYDAWALAEGAVTVGPVRVTIEANRRAVFDAALVGRVHALSVPAHVSRNPVNATLTGDPDLTHARLWLDAESPPANLAFAPLPADGRVALPVLGEGAHVVRAQMATAAYAQGAAGDPANGFLAAVSPTLRAEVTLDSTPPSVAFARVNDGAPWVSSAAVELTITCLDAGAESDGLTLTVVGTDGAHADGPLRPLIALALVGADGPRSLSVSCTDASGNESEPAILDVGLDRAAPTVVAGSFRLNGGQPNEPARSRIATARFQVADATSGVGGVALSATQIDCAGAAFVPAGNGTLEWLLPDVQGPRSLYLCVRDRAGNVSAAVESVNALSLDTSPPSAGVLTLAGGAPFTRVAGVTRALGNVEPNTRIRLSGDLAPNQTGPYTLAQLPDPLVLSAGQGLKSVSAVLVDDAGNESPPFSDVLTLDSVAPLSGTVSLADGASTVNTRTIPVSVSGTDADTMMLYEVGANAACGDPVCGEPRFVPLSSSSTLTLSEGQGEKRLCWKFCDLAGNGTAVGMRAPNLSLGNYVARPTPVITGIDPQAVVGLSADASAPIGLLGRGISANTQAQVGEFLLACTSVGAESCQPDAAGGCAAGAGVCGQTCAERCEIRLPPEVSRRAGTYVVRLVTPAPVVDGLGTSIGVGFLDVVAPLPRIISTSIGGVIQDVAAGGPVAQSLAMDVTGLDFLDNVTLRLGPNYARVRSITRDAVDPRLSTARIEVSTENLLPSDLEDADFIAENPSPGGGAFPPRRFGLNPRLTACPDDDVCVSNLRRTRVSLPDGRGRAQEYRPGSAADFSLLRWSGGTGARVRSSGGQTAARLVGPSGVLPLPWPARGTVRLEDALGTGPITALSPASRRNDGTFGPALGSPASAPTGAFAVGDVDLDGFPDAVLLHAVTHSASVHLGAGDGTFNLAFEMAIRPGNLAGGAHLSDLDGDGFLDLVLNDGTVYSGLGDGRFRERSSAGTTYFVRVGDLNGDGAPDLVFAVSEAFLVAAVYVRLGIGDGTFRDAIRAPCGRFGNVTDLADLDGDGALDVIATLEAGLSWLRGNGDGTLQPPVAIDAFVNPAIGSTAFGDLDLDGFVDFVGLASARLVVRRGLGNGTFVAAPDVGLQLANGPLLTAGAPVLADLNGDGFLDLTMPDASFSVVFRGNGDGTFVSPVVGELVDVLGLGAFAKAVADVDGDGALDLVSAGSGRDVLTVRLGRGRAGGAGRLQTLASNFPMQVLLRDMNADGRNDLLVRSNANLSIRSGQAGGGFAPETLLPAGPSPFALAVGHISADARLDYVGASVDNGSVSVGLQNPDGTYALPVEYNMGSGRAVALGDLNGDGRQDVVVNGAGGLGVRLAIANGTLGPLTNYPAADGAVALGDFDGDDQLDAVVSGAFYAGGGDGTLGAAIPIDARGSWLVPADFDADGDLDLVTCGGLVAYLNDGHARFAQSHRDDTNLGCWDPIVADVNGDGLPDVVASSTDHISMRVYISTGAGRFTPAGDFRIGKDIASVAAADVNGDRVLDIVAGHSQLGELTVWETPTASTWAQVFSELAAPRTPIVGPETTFGARQAMQFIDKLAVRVRLEGTNLQNLRLRLRAPDGREVLLDNGAGWANRTVWRANYTNLAALQGWQPEGDWTLVVQGGANAQAVLSDFAVVTHGSFTRPAP